MSENLFYSFDARLRATRADENAEALPWEMAAGIIAKNSEFGAADESTHRDTHVTSFVYGVSENDRPGRDGLDLFDFIPAHGEKVRRPTTYGGLSGGAVWALGDTPSFTDRILKGIVFHESDADEGGHRRLICHGPKCLYRTLPEAIRQRFPSEFNIDA